MATEIQFTKSDAMWEHSFTSEGPAVVQINTDKSGRIFVYASYSGMESSLVGEASNAYGSAVFQIDFPAGMAVTIVSSVEVTKAVIENVQNSIGAA